jgi:hypothetical protein
MNGFRGAARSYDFVRECETILGEVPVGDPCPYCGYRRRNATHTSPKIEAETQHPNVVRRERDILERAGRTVAWQAKNASAILNEAYNAGLDGSHPVTPHAKSSA